MWILDAFLSAVFAGATSILAKAGIRNTDSHLATALRTIVVLLFSWIMVFVGGAHVTLAGISVKSIVFLLLSGIATGASWLCYFRALQLGDIHKVVSVDKSSTVLTIILAAIFLGEPISGLKAICIILIAVGTYVMLERGNKVQLAEGGEEKNTHSYKWLLYAASSAVFASLTAILGKIGVTDIDSNLGTAIRTVVVLVMAWLIVYKTGRHKEIPNIDKKSWLFIGLSGFATGLSWLYYYRALRSGPASVVVPIDKLSILVTVAFAYLFFQERLSKKALIGLGMLTLGTLLLLL